MPRPRFLVALFAAVAAVFAPACATLSQVDLDKLAAGILEVAEAVAPNSEARELINAAQAALAAGDLGEARRLLDLARAAWKRDAEAGRAAPFPDATAPPK